MYLESQILESNNGLPTKQSIIIKDDDNSVLSSYEVSIGSTGYLIFEKKGLSNGCSRSVLSPDGQNH